mmetsp:Transcript_15709/g.38913  ORF Transcript_15709/g.38913 Transcript_15709/m.38913 type:complete len:357 (-) Transcript_15709:745-1815(-)
MSTPPDTSSSRRTWGSVTRESAKDNFRIMPPEYCPTGWWLSGSRPTSRRIFSINSRFSKSFCPGLFFTTMYSSRCCCALAYGNRCLSNCGTIPIFLYASANPSSVTFCCRKRISPSVGPPILSQLPESSVNIVDLPAPLGPSRPNTSPLRTPKVTPFSAHLSPLADANFFVTPDTETSLTFASASPAFSAVISSSTRFSSASTSGSRSSPASSFSPARRSELLSEDTTSLAFFALLQAFPALPRLFSFSACAISNPRNRTSRTTTPVKNPTNDIVCTYCTCSAALAQALLRMRFSTVSSRTTTLGFDRFAICLVSDIGVTASKSFASLSGSFPRRNRLLARFARRPPYHSSSNKAS